MYVIIMYVTCKTGTVVCDVQQEQTRHHVHVHVLVQGIHCTRVRDMYWWIVHQSRQCKVDVKGEHTCWKHHQRLQMTVHPCGDAFCMLAIIMCV